MGLQIQLAGSLSDRQLLRPLQVYIWMSYFEVVLLNKEAVSRAPLAFQQQQKIIMHLATILMN